MRTLIVPDKFRGSASAAEVASAMAAGVRRAGCDEVIELPLSDGGEGFAETLVQSGRGRYRNCEVNSSDGTQVGAVYGFLSDGTAVVESAAAIGLEQVGPHHDPVSASSAGVGQLIRHAIEGGAQKVLVGVGGTATSDGGAGALEALDWSFDGVEVIVACDVSTRFVDAARVFSPQKGADAVEVELLEARLAELRGVYRYKTDIDVHCLPGSGAGGGLAGGLAAIGASLTPGFPVVAEHTGLARHLRDCDVVMTGEGRLDATSLTGKVVGEVLALAARYRPQRRLVITGQAKRDEIAELALDDDELVVLAEIAPNIDQAMARASELIEAVSEERMDKFLF